MEKRIVVCQSSWVLVGEYQDDGREVVLTNASVVRKWGSVSSLGQLAVHGRLPGTILVPAGTIRIPAHSVVLTFDCVPEAWQ